ncbi:MAG: hypothetical protein E6H66_02930 [Betaproteobacteria bacterium]|nr:MAG: hypothetical protein E6H66_02930 [Betaproteobacteria bacterium]
MAIDGPLVTQHRFFAYGPLGAKVVTYFESCDFQRLGRSGKQYQQQGRVPLPAVAVLPDQRRSTVNVLVRQRTWPLGCVDNALRVIVIEGFKVVILARPDALQRRHFVGVYPFHAHYCLQVAGKCLHALLHGRAAQPGFLRNGYIGLAAQDPL